MRRVLAALCAFGFLVCSMLSVATALDMRRVWTGSACFVPGLTAGDFLPVAALYPEIRWTAYAQSQPESVSGEDSGGRTAEAAILRFVGEPGNIAFFNLVSGRLPQAGESGVCALDKDSAFKLFGGLDVRGVSLRVGKDEAAQVVGVMDVDRPLVLLPAKDGTEFERLIVGNRGDLQTFVSSLGVEMDDFELSGEEIVTAAWCLCAVPYVLSVFMVLFWMGKRGGVWKLVSGMLVCVVALGVLLSVLVCVPVRLLPARWSDFAFYGGQYTAFMARPERFMDVRDQLIQKDVLRAALWCALGCVALWMERMCLRCGNSR